MRFALGSMVTAMPLYSEVSLRGCYAAVYYLIHISSYNGSCTIVNLRLGSITSMMH